MVIFSVANGGFERSFWVGLTHDNLIISFVSVVNIGIAKCRTVVTLIPQCAEWQTGN
jgi:hypothetical protein